MTVRRRALGAAIGLGVVGVVFLLAAPSCDNEGGILGPRPLFTRTYFPFPVTAYGSLAWGDYDSDGDMDLALAGANQEDASVNISEVFRNDAGRSFTSIGAGLTGASFCSLAWGDCDGDGDIDLAVEGMSPNPAVYRNDGGGVFADLGAGLRGIAEGALAWGDYDNDGDLDLTVAGWYIYTNDGGAAFTETDMGLTGKESVVWGDYDNDGDLDLASAGGGVSVVYRNDGGGTFTDIDAGLTGVRKCCLAWGDYDNDGDLDLALAGDAGGAPVTIVYHNDGGGAFLDVGAAIVGVEFSSLAWGDCDNDGDLDLALEGYDGEHCTTRVYRNDGGGTFVDVCAGLPGRWSGSVAWGDYDSDSDLDLAVQGLTEADIYRNNCKAHNRPPSPATGLSHSVSGSAPTYDVTFSWDASTDDHTPTPGLTYNLRVWTDDGSVIHEVMPGMSDPATGRRLIPAMGNCQHAGSAAAPKRSWALHLPADTYYWSVQAVDTAFSGGPWATEQQVTVP